MRSKKARKQNKGLQVIDGEGKNKSFLSDFNKKIVFFLLLFLALFLVAQILIGWVYRKVTRDTIGTVIAVEGVLPITHSTSGILTFEEEIILASQSGFVYYKVENGKRVSVGTELATIAELPMDEPENEADDVVIKWDGVHGFGDRFMFGDESFDEDYGQFSFSNRTESVTAPVAGLVILQMDGWEEYGPGFQFPYLESEEEFLKKHKGDKAVSESGERVHIFHPLLKILNNHYWYYSAVLPPSPGESIADSSQIELHFSFAPDGPVKGERVEVNQRDDDYWETTWRMTQEVGDFYNQRWCQAEIVYQELEGALIPKESLYELEGKKGIYTIEQGVVTFHEAIVLGEKEEQYLVNNLEPYKQVVTNPSRVKEGQHFFK